MTDAHYSSKINRNYHGRAKKMEYSVLLWIYFYFHFPLLLQHIVLHCCECLSCYSPVLDQEIASMSLPELLYQLLVE